MSKRKEHDDLPSQNIFGVSDSPENMAQTQGGANSTLVNQTATPTYPNDEGKDNIGNKCKSGVWGHFKKLYDDSGHVTGRAMCLWCGKNYSASSTIGTTGLWKHLKHTCKKFKYKQQLLEKNNECGIDKTQSKLCLISEEGRKKVNYWKFDQLNARKALVRMIIKDELPFKFVEREGFNEFCQEIQPEFQIPSRWTIARDIYQFFYEEKKKLHALLNFECQRASFTTDTWTSCQNISYLCLTCHFIDINWQMHKRILNFCSIKSHKGVNLGNVIDFCMNEWGFNKVMCITIDNASSNDTCVAQLKGTLRQKNAFVLDGEAFHMRCVAHILNLIVKCGMKIVLPSINKVRAACKYVRSSPQRLDSFRKYQEVVQVEYKGSVILDCETRWNSTYLMLETALHFRRVFERLQLLDSTYRNELGVFLPLVDDWDNIQRLTKFLKKFYDATLKLSGSLYSTANIFFPEICNVLKELKNSMASNDLPLANMAKKMKEKFDKYWGQLDKMNVMLFIPVILDPRYKLRYLRVKYQGFFGETAANKLVERVLLNLKLLICEYEETNFGSFDMRNQDKNKEYNENDIEIDEYFLELENENNLNTESELDKYLKDQPEKYTTSFDLLLWWKVNQTRYPILAKVARDVLAIQCSTVASESAFSTGGRTLDIFRSSLTPTTAEVLICCQDWLKNPTSTIRIEEQIEELAKFEEDIIQDPNLSETLLLRANLDS